ncbi:hypothetical protein H6F46_18225 [Limnothrix sp. FACHB-1083]|nr:hypothetical protein [Limnothrix sp. FACHB-1083]MBD2193665.1 hypothetical protein [Limnothrix sp. FACHB-1088]
MILGSFLAPTAILTFQTSALAASFTLPINTGISNKVGVAQGEVDPLFTWNYTGSASDPRYAAFTEDSNPDGTWIMQGGVTNSNTAYGTDVPESVRTQPFKGVAFLFSEFFLPAEATNIRFDVGLIAADDRVILSLNNRELGGFALPRTGESSAAPWTGKMTDGAGTNVDRSFLPNSRDLSFTDPSLFIKGGTNLIRLWVNNIGLSNLSEAAIPVTPEYSNDRASVYLKSFLRYDLPDPTPEPTPEPTPTPTPTPEPTPTPTPTPTPEPTPEPTPTPTPEPTPTPTPEPTPTPTPDLEKTPEPSALLGLAGLVALGLRRKLR